VVPQISNANPRMAMAVPMVQRADEHDAEHCGDETDKQGQMQPLVDNGKHCP